MNLVTSPDELPELTNSKAEENKVFHKFLNSIPSADVDKLVHHIATEVTQQIDCTQCANCCKSVEPGLHDNEIETLAKRSKMNLSDFSNQHVAQESGTAIKYLKHKPCIFLAENKCSIYEDRPSACADYPHLHQARFKFRFKSIMFNYRICPIVFNTVEKLKIELGFY